MKIKGTLGYDPELDVVLKQEQKDFKEGTTRLIVKVCRYNEGEARLQLNRLNLFKQKNFKETERYVNLGRMSKDEIAWLYSVLPYMAGVM